MDISVTPIDGINEKLKRAHENIVNLEVEIARFFKKPEHPVLSNVDLDVLMESVAYYGKLPVPLRFSVLAGEVLHHLRSTLDHIAWLLALPEWREERPTKVQFPVFRDRFDKNGTPSLKGKVEMFASNAVQEFIKRVQPYERSDPLNDTLWILHDLDSKAKHRELPLVFTVMDMGSPELNAIGNFYADHPAAPMSAQFARAYQQKMKPAVLVAFTEFGKGKPETMVDGLHRLKTRVDSVLNDLVGELAKC